MSGIIELGDPIVDELIDFDMEDDFFVGVCQECGERMIGGQVQVEDWAFKHASRHVL